MEIAFNNLVRDIIAAGKYAAAEQHTVSRRIKSDGSILTKVDTALDKLLTDKINEHFPDSNIITEENPLPDNIKANRKWIFTIDPIDGTDSFSQGMPGWCLAVGILNSDFEPVGAIINAPRWGIVESNGSLLTLMPGGPLKVNGKELDISNFDFDSPGQLMLGSGVHQIFEYSTYKQKLRGAGSAVVNIMAPLLHSDVKGAVITPCYIWDVAAAHAVIRKAGLDLEYYGGEKVNYKFLMDRTKAPENFVAGSTKTRKLIRKYFKLR